MLFPRQLELDQQVHVVRKFLGYDRSPCPQEGSLREMENMTCSGFPSLCSRRPRGSVAQFPEPQGILGGEAMAYASGGTLYYNGFPVEGISLTPGYKTMLYMGAYLVVLPDKVYVNTADLTDRGSFDNERSLTCTAQAGLRCVPCTPEGAELGNCTAAPQPPENPSGGDYWLDTSGDTHALKIYGADSGLWASVPVACVRLEGAGIGSGFCAYDGVTVEGLGEESLNGSAILQGAGEDFLVIPGTLAQSFTQTSGTVFISRKSPDMDFVTECGNRLWGCKYGLAEGKAVNEIYACALGDFKNWNKFQGLSTDSYAASRGSQGPWTGAVTHLGCPLFFKENTIEKVYPSSDGAHQIVTTGCRGVEAGSHGSLCIVGELLYYKAPGDICVYDGSLPVSISRPVEDLLGHNATGGSTGSLYYISMTGQDGENRLLVYDTIRGLWCGESGLDVLQFTRRDGELYALEKNGCLTCLTGGEGEPEGKVTWSCQTGELGLDKGDAKVVTGVKARLEPLAGTEVNIYIRYNGTGPWIHSSNLRARGNRLRSITLMPRRCDHFALRIEGRGHCRIYGIILITEKGGDPLWV